MASDLLAPTVLEQRASELELRALYRDLEGVGRIVYALLESLETPDGALDGNDDHLSIDWSRVTAAYTRIASALTSLLADPALELSPTELLLLTRQSRTIANVFFLSGFGDTDHLLELLGSPQTNLETGQSQFHFTSPTSAALFIICYSLYGRVELDTQHLLRANPDIGFPAYFMRFSTPTLLHPRASERVQQELNDPSMASDLALPDTCLPALSHFWMACTYASSRQQHRIKAQLNLAIQRWLHGHGLTARRDLASSRTRALDNWRGQDRSHQRSAASSRDSRPILLVASERYTHRHVMYRAYHPLIKQLGRDFRVVAMTTSHEIDDISRQDFDDVVTFDTDPFDLGAMFAKVRELAPDVIYFPSLGMDIWTILLANTRHAPVQFMTLGHPATSRSRFIDYVFMPEELVSDDNDVTERVVTFRRQAYAVSDTTKFPTRPPRKRPPTLRIAIFANTMKLTVPFIALCQRIYDDAARPIEFHFFPNAPGITRYVVAKQVSEYLPGALVHPPTEFGRYLERLAACDLCFGSFPFGGATSAQDALALGIPLVCMEGPAAHQRTEPRLARQVGLPAWTIAKDEESYRAAAHQLIHNDDERMRIAKGLQQREPERALFDRTAEPFPTDFVDAVAFAFEQHERIVESTKRVWGREDRATFEH